MTFPTPQVKNLNIFKVAVQLPIKAIAFDITTGNFVITLSEPIHWSRGEYEETEYEDKVSFGTNFYAIQPSLRETVLTTDQNVPVTIFEDGKFLGHLKTIFDQGWEDINGRNELCVRTSFFLSPVEGMARVMRVIKTHESHHIMR